MIWLKRYNTVFLKIPKNASEAIAHHLQTYMYAPEDIYTYDNGFGQNLLAPHDTHCHMDVKYILSNNLATADNTFIGIIRHPVERLLSLYLYRHRQKRYDTKISVEDFRTRTREGFIIDHPWHMQPQHSFLMGANKKVFWSYDYLPQHLLKFSGQQTFSVVNKSIPTKNTKDLINVFYDDATLKAVHKYWEMDIDLYYGVLDAETKLAEFNPQ